MKKNIFSILLISFLCICSVAVVSLLQPVPLTKDTIDQSNLEGINVAMKDAIIYLVDSTDSKYDPITLTDKLTLEDQTLADIQDNIEANYQAYLLDDRNFRYKLTTAHKTKQSGWKENLTKKEKEDALFYATVIFDKKGDMKIDVQSDSPMYLNDNISFLDDEMERIFYDHLNYDYVQNHNVKEWYDVHMPKDVTFEVYIPSALENNNKMLFWQLYDSYQAQEQLFLVVGITAFIVFLFALLTPFAYEMKHTFTNRFVHHKAEFIFVSLILFGIVAFVTVFGIQYTQTGILYHDLMVHGWKNMNVFVFGVFCILSFLSLLGLYLVTVYSKSLFHYGLFNTIKHRSCLGSMIKRIKAINWIEFTSKFYLKVLVLLVTNIFLIMLMFEMFQSSIIFFFVLCIYSILLFIGIHIIYRRARKQYNILLDMSDLLTQGRFDDVHKANVPTFQGVYENLLCVKDGFAKALEEGIQSQNVKAELISNVSHDLKTPLTGLKNYVELMQSEQDPEKMKDYLSKINHYTNRLDHLVVDLFDVSKANAGALPVHLVSLDICEMIKQVQAEYAASWQQQQLTTVYTMPDEPIMVCVDPDKMVRVFENLIQNINRYALPNTRVFIDVKVVDDKVQIIYKNTSKEPLNFSPEEITERFVRGDKSRHDIGSGLGLAIVKSFTELQQGSFTIDIDGDLFKAILSFSTLPRPIVEKNSINA